MKKKILIGVGIVVVVGGLVAGNVAARRDHAVDARLDKVSRRDLVSTVTASGNIAAKKKVDISPDIQGRIIGISVKEGDHVTKGQVLLRIDPSQFEAQLARAEAALSSSQAATIQAVANKDQALRAAQRARELKRTNTNLLSDEQLEQAETSYKIADANATSAQHQVDQASASLREAQDQLAKTVIKAPMDGEVTRVAVEEGEVAVPGTFSKDVGLLVTVSDLSVINLKVQVDETDVVRLAMGDSTEIKIDAFPDTSFTGRVTKISHSASLSSAQAAAQAGATDRAVDYDVEITLDHPPRDIRPDLSATAKIITDTRRQVVSIPIIALTLRENTPLMNEMTKKAAGLDTAKKKDQEGVFVVNKGIAQFRPVKVGIAGEEFFEVIDGLKEGDSIVAGPYQTIRDMKDSTAVKAQQAPAPAKSGASKS
ncbi:MAG TPA: efflux RND transporter periplasmic adaptor subunit [Gemmatimonadales bacterium]